MHFCGKMHNPSHTQTVDGTATSTAKHSSETMRIVPCICIKSLSQFKRLQAGNAVR
jgi:hypothetical protein